MPPIDSQGRPSENVPGAFYVDEQCLDCDLCRETLPTVFARNEHGYSYVKKQPETAEELTAAREAIELCCVEAIHEEGASRNRSPIPTAPDYPSAKQWWEFWKK